VSNRTDFFALIGELVKAHVVEASGADRVETELHNAYVAGQEGPGCGCRSCAPPTPCAGEHDFYQAQCWRCGYVSTGADFLEAARKFREAMKTEGIDDPFADAFCEHGRLVTRSCDQCDEAGK
jgi:hypothetical protein